MLPVVESLQVVLAESADSFRVIFVGNVYIMVSRLQPKID